MANYELSLPNNYKISSTSADRVRLWTPSEGEVILPKVVEASWDNRYIIVKQMELAFYDKKGKKVSEAEEFIKEELHEDIICYWIVDMKENKKYGPYETKKELIKKQKELGIEKLKLKNLSEYNEQKDYGWE